jgi:5-methyltetrahydrofolate--homocysteine methyltransferase
MSVLQQLGKATMEGDQNLVPTLTRQALDEGLDVNQIIQDGFIPAMGVVGEEFAAGTRYIPEMLLAARAMQAGMNVVKPLLEQGEVKTLAKVVLGTVQGDLHDIGKNLVGMMLEGAGVEVIDLGVDVSAEKFVAAVKTEKPQFVALSALLTTTMTAMRETIDSIQEAGLRDSVKILVGGAPVSQAFAEEIGADGYGANATQAVNRIKELLD